MSGCVCICASMACTEHGGVSLWGVLRVLRSEPGCSDDSLDRLERRGAHRGYIHLDDYIEIMNKLLL